MANQHERRAAPVTPETVRITLLGGFRISMGPRLVRGDGWRLRKAASLVKLLALAPDHRLHREQVMDLLWPDLDPKAAANNLRGALHVARGVLGAATVPASRSITVSDGWLDLCPEERVMVDVDAFEEAIATARRSDRNPAAYRAATDLYAGVLLPEDRYEEWAEVRREALRRSYLSLMLDLAQIHEERGERERAIEALSRVVEADPAHEEARMGLMRIYAGAGRRREALLHYERLRKAMSSELDAEPGEPAWRLYTEIEAMHHRRSTAPPESRSGPPAPRQHNLPIERTSFVGREDQRLEVGRMLAMTRLLTLTGAGGLGKTRLSLAVAADLLGAYPEGAWVVKLASISDAGLVPQAVAQSLRVREQPGRPMIAALKDHLASKKLLLVLDNCEHVIHAAADLVESLLDSCPDLRILATSREALNIAGELVWLVPPLSVPESLNTPAAADVARFESVRLFVERARYRDPAFALRPENIAAVLEICRKLDGIPLALELAAARMGVLSVQQICARLDDSLKLLAGSRTAPPRQRTLEGALDWSFELLEEPERRLFRRLAVFAGGWTLEAAQAVGREDEASEAEVLDLLLRLVDRSLAVVESDLEDAVRYRMLQPVRQYARKKLEESGDALETRRRHTAWFLSLAERAELGLKGPRQMLWMERLVLEHDDLRAALGWLKESGAMMEGMRLAGTLGMFWYLWAYFTEGQRWLEEFLEGSQASERTDIRAKALYNLGTLIYRNADHASENPVVARAHLEESIEIYGELGDGVGRAAALRELGNIGIGTGDWRMVDSALQEALELDRRAQNEYGEAVTRTRLGIAALLQDDHEAAEAEFEISLKSLGGSGSRNDINTNLYFLGCLACDRGDYETARVRFAEMTEGNAPRLYRWAVPIVMLGYARLATARGQSERALRLAGAADAQRRLVGGSTGPTFVAYLRRGLEPAWRDLGPEKGAEAFEHGQEMAPQEIMAYVLDTEELSTPSERPDDPPAMPLTPREREVAMLVARELSNRQIAQRLVISEGTVATHVHKILEKLGLRSRTQIAAWALEQLLS